PEGKLRARPCSVRQPHVTNLIQLLPSCQASPTASPPRYADADRERDTSRRAMIASTNRALPRGYMRRLPRCPSPPGDGRDRACDKDCRSSENDFARSDEAHHHVPCEPELPRARHDATPNL